MNDLTPEEVQKVRELILAEERATWAWKKLKILVPAVVAIVIALWQGIDWVIKHMRFQ